ncbi:NusG domain II-containing protein [Peptostreptococcus canis]|uniref:NusG domain II-containing protein n=1 Tax=Peptostreptococcus canis TaxID=1159213 RepID=A0ABR6TJS5_9FIRM|nr:NusG domain II-containing protein [Peptostreptococcus canis]MBC2575670.1 NusG domain II-containing protein [Peptostreptococcus canis]MBP1997125.1 hypothetical protein [Peptostreptococcus canis]
MKKKDIILIAVILAIIAQVFLLNKYINSGKSNKVEIYVNKRLYKEVPIDKTQTIRIEEKESINIVKIHDNGVEMTSANCPDLVCVKTGFIKNPGESIVCLPHRISIKIVGEKDKNNQDVIVK